MKTTTAEELLLDLSPLAYRRVPEVPKDSLYKLALHPDSAVRTAAAFLCSPDDAPCFIGDDSARVNRLVAHSIMRGPARP